MARTKSSFVCQECGAVHLKWMGKCPDCGAWDSLEETRFAAGPRGSDGRETDPQRGLAESWAWRAATGAAERESASAAGSRAIADAIEHDLHESPRAMPLESIEQVDVPRLSTRIDELDRVLGGGLVPGSVILIGGEPGIGKSTLTIQTAAEIAAVGERRVLYVTTEESAQQIQMRARRLELNDNHQQLFILADTNLARVFEQARSIQPDVLIIDSVQMVYKSNLDASPGSVTQLRRCCTELVYLAKLSSCCVILVGHVTKEGRVAGPRLLEHLVDSVLYFEGDRYHAHRLIRAVKNRYGNTLEIGLFEMTGRGLMPVAHPNGLIGPTAWDDDDNSSQSRSGTVVCPVMQGTRCFLVEIQALTTNGILGAAKRKVSGLDSNRLPMLVAVLEKHGDLRLADQDIFTSSVGGLRVVEPSVDLAVCLAIAGAHYGRALASGTVALGEVGLGGEIRPVNQIEHRLRESVRLGFKRAIVSGYHPHDEVNLEKLGVETLPVRTIAEALGNLE